MPRTAKTSSPITSEPTASPATPSKPRKVAKSAPSSRPSAAKRTKAELLESLVNPVAKIVPGYGLVSITMKDGSNHTGALFKEDKTAVSLRLADSTEKKLPRAQITMQTPPVSMMPTHARHPHPTRGFVTSSPTSAA